MNKIGLTFFEKSILPLEEKQWKKVSLYERIEHCMPSTTNTLEAVHGHLNSRVPRRNYFYSALLRVYDDLNSKYEMIDQRIQHNYAYIKRITKHKLENIDEEELKNQILFYETDIGSCKCGNNKLESANFMVDIPCFHRLHLGAEFNDCPKMNYELNNHVEKLEISHKIKKKDPKQKDKCHEIEYVIRTIKHFSGYKRYR